MDLNNKYIFEGLFGLERETMRTAPDGHLAKTPHPFSDDRYLSRDFCESQLELITPACETIDSLMNALAYLDSQIRSTLKAHGEYLWLSSNPPHIDSDDDIIIADFKGKQASKKEYRIKLASRYGKRLMLYSGIHFNFSFSERFIESVYDGEKSLFEFKNDFYFRLSKQVFRYSWLIVLLTAASPVYDLSLDADGLCGSGFDDFASRRGGAKGYWNKFIPILDYSDLRAYIKSINSYIESGALFSSGELYLPMRLKPSGDNSTESLIEHGVNHIELRMFDVNPLAPLGIFKEDLYFAHYFLIYLTQLPDFTFTSELQETAIQNHRSAAKYDIDSMIINGYPAKEAAKGLLDDMTEYFKAFPNIIKNIEMQKNKIQNNKRYCVEVYNKFSQNFIKEMINIAELYDDKKSSYDK